MQLNITTIYQILSFENLNTFLHLSGIPVNKAVSHDSLSYNILKSHMTATLQIIIIQDFS